MSDAGDTGYVRIFDTTLRDGEQSPGASMTSREKVEIARALSRLGVDVIEAGFPAASPDDLAGVRAVAEEVGTDVPEGRPSREPPIVCGLARAKEDDIRAAWEAVKNAARPRIHTFLATSPIHREHKLRMSEAEVIEAVRSMVARARERCDDVELSAEDASRTEHEFLFEVLAAAIEAGASTINIPDTVGYATPDEMGRLITRIREHVPGVERVILSVHCHDDLGMATANTLAALSAGARQAEVTINGIGERAGNTALEEVVMALATRAPRFGLRTGIDTTRIARTSRLVSSATGMAVQPNKAIVGANAFAHEAGIHQDGMLKHGETYEIMRPESVGVAASRLVLGKHSGRHAFGVRLAELGYGLDGPALEEAFACFKSLADRKKQVNDADLIALVASQLREVEALYRLDGLQISCGTMGMPTATVRLATPGDGVVLQAALGSGPVDACFKAIEAIVGVSPCLLEYSVSSVTEGIDALGEVSVRIAADRTAGQVTVQAHQHAGFQPAFSGSAPASECRGVYAAYMTRPSADVSPDQSRLGSRPLRAPERLPGQNPQHGMARERVFHGRGTDTDILVASAKAYLDAVNRLLASEPACRAKAS